MPIFFHEENNFDFIRLVNDNTIAVNYLSHQNFNTARLCNNPCAQIDNGAKFSFMNLVERLRRVR